MTDAIMSSLQLNQIHDQGNYGGYNHDLANSSAEGNHGYNVNNPWLTLDHELSVPFYPINGNREPSTAAVASSGFQWMQNDVQLHHSQQPIYDVSNLATAHNSRKTHTEDFILEVQPHHLMQESIGKPLKQEKDESLTLASLELLTNYGKGMMINNIDPILGNNLLGDDHMIYRRWPRKLSLADIVRIAGEKYVQFSTQKDDGFSMFMNNNYYTATSDLSPEEAADVELVQLLFAAAEGVGHHQFDLASVLINHCQWVATDSGNAVQRVAFYFAESLQRRIDMETGRTTPERMSERTAYAKKLELDFNLSFLVCHEAIPFSQTMQFASVQAILDSVKTSDKIHVVDIHIRSGIQWTVLMQALSERDELPKLKVSALAANNEKHMEETGKRLKSFAQTLNLDFTFNVISVKEMKELKEEMFKKETDEAVAVYSQVILRTMIADPDSLGHLMRIIKRLKPVIVAVTEVEADHNSQSFVNRFTESLFFYGAFFDCMEDCMDRDDQHRKIIEGIYLGEGIRNMVGSDGDKRCTRNVKLEVWREFFAWYGMVEMELSDYAVDQANMVIRKFPKADHSCTINQKGKGIVTKWKGTPIHSLTVWKFL